MITTILFDLDDTLYPPEIGIMDRVRTLMLQYIQERFGLSPREADDLRRRYFLRHGTTMRGLQIGHQIDPDEFLAYVHNMPLEGCLEPNPRLDTVLAQIRQDKVVFTNASREHAERVLDRLGIRRHFSRIVDVRDMDYVSKPQPGSYRRICELLAVDPHECMIVEDNVRNLLPAKNLGMVTVLVQAGGDTTVEGIDFVIDCVEEIARVLDGPLTTNLA